MTMPGWYLDPQDSARERRWDGERWTDETREKIASTPAEKPKKPFYRRTWVLVTGGVLVLLWVIGVIVGPAEDDAPTAAPTQTEAAPQQEEQVAASPTVVADEQEEAKEAPGEVVAQVAVPDVVGQSLDRAIDQLEAAGFVVTASDANGDRSIIVRSNWVVVDQSQEGTSVALGAVKADESPAALEAQAQQQATDADQVEAIKARVLDSYGVASFTDYLTVDATSWVGYVADIRIERSNLYVTLQVGRTSAEKEMAERAANYLSVIGTDLTNGLGWAIAEDGGGGVLSQKQISG